MKLFMNVYFVGIRGLVFQAFNLQLFGRPEHDAMENIDNITCNVSLKALVD